jgi:sugar fermentation stimulation protein A
VINSGIYQLLIELPRNCVIEVGNLGNLRFSRGLYIYTGSAKANLRERISRHFRKEKRFHWHIDYLLREGEIIAYNMQPYIPDLECDTNLQTHKAISRSRFISGFGSSDCKCFSHLVFIQPE